MELGWRKCIKDGNSLKESQHSALRKEAILSPTGHEASGESAAQKSGQWRWQFNKMENQRDKNVALEKKFLSLLVEKKRIEYPF